MSGHDSKRSTPGSDVLTIVVAAVIRDRQGRILLTQRPVDSHMGGLWEFPGGKVAPGETPEDALRRELREELGVGSEVGDPITFALHHEPGLHILLLFFWGRITAGEPRGSEGQNLAWVVAKDLQNYPTPPADALLVRRLSDEEDLGV